MTEKRDVVTGIANPTKSRRVPTPGTLRYFTPYTLTFEPQVTGHLQRPW